MVAAGSGELNDDPPLGRSIRGRPANTDGSFASEVKYIAFGEVRSANGVTVTLDKPEGRRTTSTPRQIHPRQAGQRNEVEIGLDYYAARWYDPVLAHFVQADSMIPQAGRSKGIR